MAKKRRTRKQKAKAKHQFAVSWKPSQSPSVQVVRRQRLSRRQPGKSEAETTASEAVVKRQFKKSAKAPKRQNAKKEKAKDTAKDAGLASVKPDIIKSLLLASLILCLEIMIYLAWPK